MKNKIQILHVDDNALDRQLVKDALCKENNAFEVIEADSREKFEQHLDENDFDLILSDFNILGFDGLQLLQIVHDKDPGIPVIIVTGTGSEEIAIQAIKMGASDYVIKSAKHIRGLAPTIENVLANKKLQNERVEALEALKNSEIKFRSLFQNMQDVFYQINEHGIITEVSPSIFRLAGYQRDELIGQPVTSFYYDLRERETMFGIIAQKGEVWDFEVRLKTKSGKVKYASLNAHLMSGEYTKQSGIEGSLRDIDERKRMEMELVKTKEKAEESNRLKTAFLQNMSHEIRTPMNGILGFMELLKMPNLSDNMRDKYIDIVSQSGLRLLDTLNEIIEISKIEAGQVEISLSEIFLPDLIRQHYEFFIPLVEKKGLKLRINYSEKESWYIITDKLLIDSVLTNLLNNAVKFTQQGFIEIGCKKQNDELLIYIKDTGMGIPKNRQEAIFEPFVQSDLNITRAHEGSGLGLSICKSYIEMLKGKIWVESAPNAGSTFYISIPTKKQQIKKSKGKELEITNTSHLQGLKILIAEDDEMNYLFLETVLANLSIDILHAVNGKEAIIALKNNPDISLILMDIKMPVMDGIEATQQIRKFNSAIPIIAQTAYAFPSEREVFIKAGCNDYISKPINQNKLIYIISQLI